VKGGWRKLLNETLHKFYSSPYIIRVTKSMRMRWARNLTHAGDIRISERKWPFGIYTRRRNIGETLK
jgi:hypothetical protein